MERKATSGIMLTLLMLSVLTLAFNIQLVEAEPRTWTVDDDGPADFHTIQEAINAATDGDTIYVCDGTYYEQVVIYKAVWLIGEHPQNTIIDGGGSYGSVVRISADNVKFAGFTVRECGRDYYMRAGIAISSSNNVVVGNKVVNNLNGIVVYGSSNTISGNNVTNNGDSIYIKDSSNNAIASNNVANNGDGIVLHGSSNNTILDNKVTNNRYWGILLTWSSNDNTAYHNKIINNNPQARVFRSTNNNWDAGYPSGGNYWSDYTGVDEFSGLNQDQPGSDGIGDTPYASDGAYDRYPLMNLSIAPMADFAWLPDHPLVGKIVTFYPSGSFDPDGLIAGYRWDFGDGNITTIADPIITHIYTTPGTYIVNLTVTDNDGLFRSVTKSITIEKASSTITVNVDPETVIVDSDMIINGTITPIRVDANVRISYRPSGGTWTTLVTVKTNSNSQYTYTWQPTDEGTYEIKASWPGDDNTLPAESEIETVTVTPPDSDPPTTMISLSGVLGNNGWFTSDVTVTLSASDDISGVDKTEYSFDNTTWNTYTTPFNITNEGTTIVYYKSTDNAENVETIRTETTKVDKTIPSGSIIINNGEAYTTSTSVTLNLTSIDVTSDVFQVRYSNDGVWDTEPWQDFSTTKAWTLTSGHGTKTVYFEIKDNAGLVSGTHSDTIILELDTDGDGTPDITDSDDDNDGVNDDEDAFPLDPTETVDTDGDGIGNNADPDDDNDGVNDGEDAFPLDPTESIDTDNDGDGNNADDDDDNDGVLDVNDAFPLDPTESVDTDGDDVGDNSDPDNDNDGMPDTWETENELNPLNAADASLDPDDDGLTNIQEYQGGTDPNVPDVEAPPGEGDPWWILGAIAGIAVIGIALGTFFLRRKRSIKVSE